MLFETRLIYKQNPEHEYKGYDLTAYLIPESEVVSLGSPENTEKEDVVVNYREQLASLGAELFALKQADTARLNQ